LSTKKVVGVLCVFVRRFKETLIAIGFDAFQQTRPID
jgi:hypothetical protein